MGDVIQEFKNAMLEHGITPPDHIIGDGNFHRFKINGKSNGTYVLHLDKCPAGFFRDYKQGIMVTWKSKGKSMSKSERRGANKRWREDAIKRQAEIDAKHLESASKANHIWNQSPYADSRHPYLVKKGILPHGLKIGFGNTLIVPLYKPTGELVNLQFIAPDGVKRFLTGGRKKGCFCAIGEPTDSVLICEGFATGASLFEDTGFLTVIAFDAGNLLPVAVEVRNACPDGEIIICGDNDASGVGQKYADEAAQHCGGFVSIPDVVGCDWNDILTSKRAEK